MLFQSPSSLLSSRLRQPHWFRAQPTLQPGPSNGHRQQPGVEQQKQNFSLKSSLYPSFCWCRGTRRSSDENLLQAGKLLLNPVSSGQEIRKKGKREYFFLKESENKDLQVFSQFTHRIFSSRALCVLADSRCFSPQDRLLKTSNKNSRMLDAHVGFKISCPPKAFI